ncbi:hypothetical protein [Swaminathania salitolerans]|uniref:Uncharacterized protein n=1 Tax=Swaminathania salitolerans TaxID=182838 RepID=A0A511BKU3_9PROT|nr:hypothetical protein [Swaminathania salitolerans]GBQ09480.1 hypothetical protein AA21291_0086 [Swaminathania salitolerans LMG 21291]GEL00957.1 hypothetical protein SSA02_01200 [Swaminathania salitolerans]
MIVLLGLTLLVALAAIGRDARILPLHGTCGAASVSLIGHGPPALAVLVLLPVLNGIGWILLGRHASWQSGDLRERRRIRQAATIATAAAILLTLLTALAATPGLPVLICIGLVLAGLCAAALPAPLLQLVGLLCMLNGLLLLGGYCQSWPLVLAALLVWLGLIALSSWLIPRLAWLRQEDPGNV